MWALVTKTGKILAKDFPTKIAAAQYKLYYTNVKDATIINQNSEKFINIDLKNKRN